MAISNRVRYFAKSAYQLCLMTGRYVTHGKDYTCTVEPTRGVVTVGDRTGNVWEVPIARSWANL